jgi:RimJ/RimL family protein N-acetyltransferase
MPIRLETSRMLLRSFDAADVDDLAALHGDPAVMRYIDDGRPVPRAVVAEETLPAILREYRQLPDGFGRFAAVENAGGAFLGWFSLRPASTRGLAEGLAGGIELGYRLRPAAWGHGYATEGARALVDSAFADLGVDRVVATTMTVNVPSRRVLEKAGLHLVRTFFEEWPEYIEGAEHGDVEYELTRAAWAAGT